VTRPLVLLDWDGTVVDSRDNLLACWYEASTAVIGRRFPETDEELAGVFRRRGAEIFAEITRDAQQATELSLAFDVAYVGKGARVFDGMPEALAELKTSGFLLGVISSKARSRLMDDVASAQLERCFDLLQSGDDVQHAKPHPEGILAAMARLAVDPSATVMVGDTDADIRAGRAAAARVMLAAWGYGDVARLADAADLVCAKPSDLARSVIKLLELTRDGGTAPHTRAP
jgi:HAD superfamily hydrolase (TIGR01509 family)